MALSIGQKLAEARQQRQLSKTQLSRMLLAHGCKLSPRQIRALEEDEAVKTSLKDVKKLFDVLDLEPEFFPDDESDISLKRQAKPSMKELARRGKEADVVSIFKDTLISIDQTG